MIERDIEFLYELGTLRNVQRTWKYFTNADFANVAEHSFRVAFLSLIIARNEGKIVDIEKVLIMALLHDVPEIRVGEVNYFMKKYVKRDESAAMQDALTDTSLQEYLWNVWKEWEFCDSLESKIVKDADMLDCEFELNEQSVRGQRFSDLIREERMSLPFFTGYAKNLYRSMHHIGVFSWFVDGLRERVNEMVVRMKAK